MKLTKFLAALIMIALTSMANAQTTSSNSSSSSGNVSHPRGAPPEAVAACQGLASGTVCSFVNNQNITRNGTCRTPREELPLACSPSAPLVPMGGKS